MKVPRWCTVKMNTNNVHVLEAVSPLHILMPTCDQDSSNVCSDTNAKHPEFH